MRSRRNWILLLLLLLLLLTAISCQRFRDYMDSKPIELSEITGGGFFFELNGSWSYVIITDSIISEHSRVNRIGEDSVVHTWQRLAFHQIVYDVEKDSVFRLTGHFLWFPNSPLVAFEFFPYYEISSHGIVSKVHGRLYVLNRGLWNRFRLSRDDGKFYRYVRRKSFVVRRALSQI